MELTHDAICGGLARMYHLATIGAQLDAIAQVFERFEKTYAGHAATERELLRTLDGRLDDFQRQRLAALVEGL